MDESRWGFNWDAMSERCIEALVLAQQEAEFLQSSFVGTEHVLVGLLNGRTLGAQILAEHQVDLPIVRATLAKFRTPGEPALMRRFSWRVKRAVEIAFEEAARVDCPFINTDHLLIGLLEQPDSTASRILVDLAAPIDEVTRRLRSSGKAEESDLLFTHDLLAQLQVTEDVPELEQVGPSQPPLSLDSLMGVLDELGRALQSAHRIVQDAVPQRDLSLDIPEVDTSQWPVVDEEVYQIAGLVRQILSQGLSRGAERVVFLPGEGALRVEYHLRGGRSEAVEIPPILRTVVPFKVMRMASMNPMEKGRELEGRLLIRLGERAFDLCVRSEPILKGLRVEVVLESL